MSPGTPTGRVRMIATDLDGTFLGGDGRVSQENLAAFLQASAMGVHLVVATGRPSRWLQALEPLIPARPQVITSNGAVIFDLQHRQVIQHTPLPVQTTLEVAADLRRAMDDVAFAVEYTEGWGRETGYPLRGDRAPETVLAASVADLLAAGTAVKLLAISPSLHTNEMVRIAEPVTADRLAATFSFVQASGLLEFCAPGVSKASALKHLMAGLGIDRAELAAFGDMPNDLPMLEIAGHPFAMADAHPLLLRRGFPTAGDHDESGVGRTIAAMIDSGVITSEPLD